MTSRRRGPFAEIYEHENKKVVPFAPYLYTVYQSAHNLRLEQCSNCLGFVDPYVEHDTLLILLDLILLKRGVYRHLLYNRGAEPRRAADVAGAVTKEQESRLEQKRMENAKKRDKHKWALVFQLGGALVLLDAFIRWSYLNSSEPGELVPWTIETLHGMIRVLLGCTAETLAFHIGVMLACYVALRVDRWLRSWTNAHSTSDIKKEFRFSLIPLTLFYSSLTKLFLLFLLTIWHPTSARPVEVPEPETWDLAFLRNKYLVHILDFLDEDIVDREWVIRNVFGGMSAGFGLRVILDLHPVYTSFIIIAGWAAKTVVVHTVSGWVGGDESMGEAWKAYSIP